MRISLRPGQRIYINGAVLRADRKVTLELMNDATFLLDSHVMQQEETTTPLRQLYFIVQTMLIDPNAQEQARKLFDHLHARLMEAFTGQAVRDGLKSVGELVADGRSFDALRAIRQLFPIEAAILLTGSESARAA